MIKKFLIVLFLFLCSHISAVQHKKVMVISSYNSSFPTFFKQIEGIQSVLDSCNISMDIEFMDTKRFNDTTNIRLFTDHITFKLLNISNPYDAIITTDDNALNFVIEKQESLFKETPVVFLGYNNLEIALKQNKNPYITGIVEAVSLNETIELMLKLFPESNTIYAIADSTKSGLSDLIRYENAKIKHPNITFKTITLYNLTFQEFRNKIEKIPSNVPVLLLSAYLDVNKNTIDFNEVLKTLNDNIKAPVFHLWEHGIGRGLLGGKVISHYQQGRKAADIVNQILSGKQISSFEVITESPNIYLFDYNSINKFQINKKLLPKNAIILNKPISFYSKHKLLIDIITPIFLILVLTVVFLLRNIFLNKKTSKYLQNTIKLLSTSQKQTVTGSWISDMVHNKTFWTDEVYRIHGLKVEKNEADIEPYIQRSLSCYDESRHQEILSKFNQCKEHGIPYEGIYKFTDFNGLQKWVKTGAEPVRKNNKIVSILGYIRDVTKEVNDTKELIHAKKIAEENEARYRLLFENNPVALLEEDLTALKKILKAQPQSNDENFLQSNPSFVESCACSIKAKRINIATLDLFGFDSKDDFLANFQITFTQKSMETLLRFLLSLNKKETFFMEETELRKKDGSILNVIIHIFTYENNKKSIFAITDISKLKNTQIELASKYMELQASEEELRTANEELILAKEKAEESNRLKTMFIQNMSHEIRTPMNGIIGFSSLLSESDSKSQLNQYIKIIQNSSNQLLRIINDILEISRLGTHQVQLLEEEVNLNELLLELFSIFDTKAKEKDLSLYLKKGLSDKDSIIITDSSKLHKTLSNLLENALKFTNKGYVEFGYAIDNNNLKIFVTDTGIGVNKDKQEIIFERFSQENKDTSVKTGGLGLGLAIAKENVEILGGNISLKSEKNVGSTFFVSIPFKPVYYNILPTESKHDELQDKTQVLIAEDEEINYLFLETLIENQLGKEYIILHAKNGKEAVEICRNKDISIVLMDLKMPVMDGYDATKEIKKIKPYIHIIAQTAYSSNIDREKALSVGCDDFISKPISPQIFIDIMNKHIHLIH